MNQSETINEIAAALAKAQGQFTNPARNREVKVKTKAGDTYTFTYATLDAIMDVVRGPLSANGLALCFSLGNDSLGPVCSTRLIHASGQWIETWTPILVAEGANAQGWGSALTYARRYGLCALLAITADEDDDGNAGCGNGATGKQRQPPPKANGKAPAPSAASAKRAEAWQAIDNAETSKTLLVVVEKIQAAKFSPEVEKELLDHATEKMRDFAMKSVNAADTLDKILKYWKFFEPMTFMADEVRHEIANAFAARETELASTGKAAA